MQTDYTEIIEALRDGQWDRYVEHFNDFQSGGKIDKVWMEIAKAHTIQFDVFERLLAWPATSLRSALNKVMPVIRRLPTISLDSATKFVRFANQAELSFRYRVTEQLQPHIAANPMLGCELGEVLRRGDVKGEGATRVWAGAFSSGAPEQAAEYALRLVTANSESDLFILAHLLQFVPTENAQVVAKLQPHEAKLASMLVSAPPLVSNDAWRAVANMANFSPTAITALHQALLAGDDGAVVAMANWLYGATTPIVGATNVPLDELLTELLRHAFSNESVMQVVDSTLVGLLRPATIRSVIFPCVVALGRMDADIGAHLPLTIDTICENSEDFGALLTKWLLGEGITFSAIRGLLSRCSGCMVPVALDAAAFQAALPARKGVAVRRLLALTHDGEVLCKFIALLAETPAMQPDGLALATHMLNEAFEEYPHATLKFLEIQTQRIGRTEPFSDLYRGVYANALRWERVLRRLPKLNELRPTESESYAIRAMKQRMNREILRGAGEKSILASIFTKVHIAQGRRFTSHTAHGSPQVEAMQLTSHSIELPSSELADPVGGMLRRAKILGASR